MAHSGVHSCRRYVALQVRVQPLADSDGVVVDRQQSLLIDILLHTADTSFFICNLLALLSIILGRNRTEVGSLFLSSFLELSGEEREEFLASLGLDEPGLNRLIRAGYALLGLITFFTAGPKEARAWTVTRGSKAPQAAGVIHTDFEHGFIRAETIAYEDYVAGNGEAGARDAGKFRLEGKDYVVQDGDVMHFRFNA